MSLNPLSGWLQESLEPFRPLVYTAFAQGLKDFLCSVLLNSGEFTSPSGASGYAEQLVNEGLSLDVLERFKDDNNSDHNRRELQFTEEIQEDHGIDHVPSRDPAMEHVPSRDPAGCSADKLGVPVDSKRLTYEVESHVWDDYTAKKEAWRRAVGVVRILLQSDMLVETGLGRRESEVVLF